MGLALRGFVTAKKPWANRDRLSGKVVGMVRRAESVGECAGLGVVDEATTDLAAAVSGADLVVFCTPVAQMAGLASRMKKFLDPGALVTDVGSVKGPLVEEMEKALGGKAGQFVGSHPMAGSERVGPKAARGNLFEGRVCAVTPGRRSDPARVEKVLELWRSVGATVLTMDPGGHDRLVARSSHMPHLLAAHLVHQVLGAHALPQQAALCAGGFRGATRVASGSPEMWRDIVLSNRDNMLLEIASFREALGRFEALLKRGDGEAALDFFQRAKALRDQWVAESKPRRRRSATKK